MHKRLKIVITESGKKQYFRGDGFWFGRISQQKFDAALAAGATIFETVDHSKKNIIQLFA